MLVSVNTILTFGIMGTIVLAFFTVLFPQIGGRRPLRLIGCCLVLLSACFALALGRYQLRLALLGNEATGQISEVHRVRGGIRPVVQFTDMRGEPITFRGATVGHRQYYTKGQTVQVRYLPSSPQFAEVASWWSLWQPILIGTTLTSLCMAGGVWLLRRDWRKQRQAGGFSCGLDALHNPSRTFSSSYSPSTHRWRVFISLLVSLTYTDFVP